MLVEVNGALESDSESTWILKMIFLSLKFSYIYMKYILVVYHDLEVLKFAFCITVKEERSENTEKLSFVFKNTLLGAVC